jgi:purine-binding chemotaxis protein CheW
LSVGGESYALPVENVLEVAELGDLATVPGAGGAVLGVCNLRGQVLPVFDLARVFGIAGATVPARLLVAEHDGRRVGLAIEDVTDVGTLPAVEEETDSEFLVGAALDDGHLVGVVDVGRVFAALERGARP